MLACFYNFKKDILIFEQGTIIQEGDNGALIDVFFEDNTEFYQELNKITLIFKNYSMNIINQSLL